MNKQQFWGMCAVYALQGLVTRGESRDAAAISARAFDIADAMAAEYEARLPKHERGAK